MSVSAFCLEREGTQAEPDNLSELKSQKAGFQNTKAGKQTDVPNRALGRIVLHRRENEMRKLMLTVLKSSEGFSVKSLLISDEF